MRIVFDTSSLSHAFEDFTHSLYSAISYCLKIEKKGRKCDLKSFLKRRAESTHRTRITLLDCDVNECLVPVDIVKELKVSPIMRDETEILVNRDYYELRRRYGLKEMINIPFSLKPYEVPESEFIRVKSYAVRRGYNISDQDIKAVALAKLTNSKLVTADKKLKELAVELNVDVVYTTE
ncbi:MAG: hypothetical protein QW734_05300 [Candidatus Bathyarchaeia archaeon]